MAPFDLGSGEREADGGEVASRGLFCGASPGSALLPVVGLAYHVFFDRSGLPDIEPFIRFTPPAIGEVYDARGTVLIRLAREYRRVVSYDEVPPVLRHAILSAEDKHFFTHSGVDYRAWPRVLQKPRRAPWPRGEPATQGSGCSLPRGIDAHAAACPRLLPPEPDPPRGRRRAGRGGLVPRLLSTALGVPATNKLLRKVEEVRLALWLEAEMRRRYGSHGARQARDLRALRQLHLLGPRPIRLRRGQRVLLRQAALELRA